MQTNTMTFTNENIALAIQTIREFFTASAMVPIFLSGANGICSMGDISTFNRIGKKLIVRLLAITIATASSAAALTTMLHTVEKKLGIDKQLCNVGVPLAMVVFKPYILIFYPAAILCLTEVYQVPITVGWIVSLFLTTMFVSVAAAPVPGGTVSCLILMFTQFQIPVEAAAVVIALDAIIDRVNTTSKEFFIAAELTQIAGSLDLLDTGTLCDADK